MKILNFSYARKFLTRVLAECDESGEPVCIVTAKKGGVPPQQMIVISKAKYDELTVENIALKNVIHYKEINELENK